MEWVETTGRSVAEAKDAALDQLGVDDQEAEIQVLEEAQTGLFGRLKVEARVRARVRPTTPRAKVDRRDRRRRERNRKGGGQRQGQRGPRSQGGAKTAAAGSSGGKSSGAQAKSGQEKSGGSTATEAPPGQADSNRRKRSRRRPTAGDSGAKNGAKMTTSQQTEPASPADLGDQSAAVNDFLGGLLQAFGRPDATVTVTTEEDTIVADVKGDELGLLVGPKGQTLQAVHELTRSVVQRRFVGETHGRVHLDVAGYRQRRTEALERFTRKVAEEVATSGEGKALEPMMASDRKVVHDVVNDIDGVDTISQGEEPYRRVIIQKT